MGRVSPRGVNMDKTSSGVSGSQRPVVQTDKGRGRGCAGCVSLVLILLVGGWAWTQFRAEAETIFMQGHITISQRTNMFTNASGSCAGRGDFENVIDGSVITIWSERKSAEIVEIGPGIVSREGTCILVFSADVEDAATYEFRIEGLPPLMVRKSMIDTVGDDGETELDVGLRWD